MQTLGGRYRLLTRIGRGGMGDVWTAHDTVLDRPVAIKLLAGDDASGHARARALNEARSAGRLAHPNVAAVYDFGTSRRGGQGTGYLVMELLEGSLLSTYLSRGPLHPVTAIRVCAEVSAGLAAAHQHGIVHRDVKPANVMLTQSGAKIFDFGIAARVGDPDRLPDGRVQGTAAYMAPDRQRGNPVAPALDMYGVGMLLYHCLTGRLPWNATTTKEMLHAHSVLPPATIPVIKGLPPEAIRMCMECLDKTPSRRPVAMATALLLAASVDAQVYLPAITRDSPPPSSPSDRWAGPTIAHG